MSTVAPAVNPLVATFRHQAGMIRQVVILNLDGITQEESLVQPQAHGNCANWVLGHLLCIYNRALPLLGQEPVMDPDSLARYDRGSSPILHASEARDMGELRAGWNAVAERVDAGLARLDPDTLDAPAPFSPSNDPNETVRSLISTVLFHQAYHAGQTGLLRRIAGKDGAIK
jgi:DinB superfamily